MSKDPLKIHNTRANVIGNGEILIARNADTAAEARTKGFRTLGNVPKLTFQTNSEVKNHFGSYRGLRKLDRSHTVNMEMELRASLDEMTPEVMQFVFFGDPDYDFGSDPSNNVQTGLSAAAGEAWDFDEGDDGVGVQAGDVMVIRDTSGNEVTDLTALTIAGVESNYGVSSDSTSLALGTDYEVDLKNGLVKFLKAINDDVITPTITSATITASSDEYMERQMPLQKAFQECITRVYIYDQDDTENLLVKITDVLVQWSIMTPPDFDGENYAGCELVGKLIEVPEDGNGGVYVANRG